MDSIFSSVKNAASSSVSFVSNGVSGMTESVGSSFTTLAVLNAETKAKILGMSPLTLAKVGRVIKNMQASAYKFSNDEIDLVVKTLYVNESDANLRSSYEMLDVKLNSTAEDNLKAADLRTILPLLGDDITEEKLDNLFKEHDPEGTGNVKFNEFKPLFLAMNPKSEGLMSNVPGMSFVVGGVSSIASGFGSNFKTLSVLRAATKAKLLGGSPLQMAKVGRLITSLQNCEYKFTDDEIDDYVRTLFVTQEEADFQALYRLIDVKLNGSEQSKIPTDKLKAFYPLLAEDLSHEKIAELFTQADPESSGSIEYDEFKMLLIQTNPNITEPAPGSKPRQSVFEKFGF